MANELKQDTHKDSEDLALLGISKTNKAEAALTRPTLMLVAIETNENHLVW